MACTSVADIVSVINQMQAMTLVTKPRIKHSAQYIRVKIPQLCMIMLPNAQVKLLGLKLISWKILLTWPERLGNRIASKVNDKISKLAENIHNRSQDNIKFIETKEMKILEIHMKDLGTDIKTDIVMVIGKKGKGIMKKMVLVRKDINLPVDTIQENQRKPLEAVMITQHLIMKT